jgi:hypothetical protein
VPVTEKAGEPFVGIMRVVADVRELLAVVAGPTSRPNGETVLIRDDGTLVSSQKAGGERIPFFAADLLRERLKGYQPGKSANAASVSLPQQYQHSRVIRTPILRWISILNLFKMYYWCRLLVNQEFTTTPSKLVSMS